MSLRDQLAAWNAAQQRAREDYAARFCVDCGAAFGPKAKPGSRQCTDCGDKYGRISNRERARMGAR